MRQGFFDYFRDRGNITGFLPRWVFLALGLFMMLFQWSMRPYWPTLLLVSLGIVAFFVADYFAPSIIPWLRERKQAAAEKFEEETLRPIRQAQGRQAQGESLRPRSG